MALAFGKNSARGVVGLDIDGGHLAAVEAADGRIMRASSVELPPGVVKDGEVVDAVGLSRAVKAFFRDTAMSKNVRLGVANQQIVVRQLELPRIEDPKELDAAVRFQASDAIAMPLEEAVLDFQVVGQSVSPEGSARMRIIVVAARETMVMTLVEALREAGVRAEGVDLSAFALIRTLAPAEAPSSGARVYCHLGGLTNLAIAVGSACLFTRTLPVSSGGDAGAELAEQIRLSIDYYMAQPDAQPAAEVVLSGPASREDGLVERLTEQVGLPVSVADPLANVEATGLSPGEDPYRHTVAAGLAMGASA
jgi:type IV pilus assembly protein PilM